MFYFLLITSAFSYALSFLFSNMLWWSVFLYPLFFLISTNINITFFDAFFWASIAYGIHMIGVASALHLMQVPLAIIVGLFLYAPLCASLPFLFTKKMNVMFSTTHCGDYCSIITNGIALFLSRMLMTHAVLLPFGRLEGYIMMHPFILLVETAFSKVLSFYQHDLLTLLFYILYILLAISLKKRNINTCFALFFLLIFIIIPSLFTEQKQTEAPGWLKKIMILPLFFPKAKNITAIFNRISEKVAEAQQKNNSIELVILPEGAIDCALNANFLENILKKDPVLLSIDCIIGASCWNENILHNSCCITKKGKIVNVYHKRHALPLTERTIFFAPKTTDKIITASKAEHILFESNGITLVAYICSELFFNRTMDDTYTNIPILALCSDIWFSSNIASYMQILMRKTAQLKAIAWHRPILYVSYSNSYYIDASGKTTTVD